MGLDKSYTITYLHGSSRSGEVEAGMSVSSSRLPDAVAVGISGLCLVHCLALPVLAVAFPLGDLCVMSHRWL